MSDSFLPSLRSLSNQSLLGSRGSALLCNHVSDYATYRDLRRCVIETSAYFCAKRNTIPAPKRKLFCCLLFPSLNLVRKYSACAGRIATWVDIATSTPPPIVIAKALTEPSVIPSSAH